MNPLHELAGLAGLQIEWEDATGTPQRVADEQLRAILDALGYPATNESAVAESLVAARHEAAICRFISARRDQAFFLPEGCGTPGVAELILEDGESRDIWLEGDGAGLRAPPIAEVGYHTLCGDGFELQLAIAPPRCLGTRDFAPGRLWGPAVQIPSLRGKTDTAFGDCGALADAARRFAERGADTLAISPTHALFPSDPSRFSPYAPSSRLFLNILLADPTLVDSEPSHGDVGPLIDWEHAIPRRITALRRTWDRCREDVSERVREFRAVMGESLERHATFDALHAHFVTEGARGWQDWPAAYHDPASDAVRAFAAEHRDAVDFFAFAQWLAAESLDRAQAAAREGGMAIGLIADLAVGMDGGGSHAWSRPQDLLDGLSVGAPPDVLGPDGQDWGLTTFSPAALQRTRFEPFIATLRAALDHAGGIRIDHALGLNRLWVVPHGGGPADGAYLGYPLDDMLHILAIESHRANAIVIGEDLGTVPQGLRPKLEDDHVLGMRVLWFERDGQGDYIPPERWHAQAVAMTGTHDVSTIAGWWQGRDIDWAWQLGRASASDSEEAARQSRETERRELWTALVASGAASGPQPSPDDPDPVVDAAIAHVASTPCELTIVPLEDLLALIEQPNLPGTTTEHPNWRRRMPADTETLLEAPSVRRRFGLLNEHRA